MTAFGTHPGASAHDNVLHLIGRMTAIVGDECASLRADPGADLTRFVEAKNRCMYELELAVRSAGGPAGLSPDARRRVARLGRALDENERLLKANITATGEALELVETLSGARAGDGTYANPAKPKGYL